MRKKRVLIPLYLGEVAPRFDLATEVLIADVLPGEACSAGDIHPVPRPSMDGLCDLALGKGVDVVICGGIEEECYHFLRWKRVEVLDNVAAKAQTALERFAGGTLKSGDILFPEEDAHVR